MARARSGIYSGINAESGATGIPNSPKSLPIQPGHHAVVGDLTLDPISIGQLFWEALCLPVPQQLPPPWLGCRSQWVLDRQFREGMFRAARRFPGSAHGVVWEHPGGAVPLQIRLPLDRCLRRIMGICLNILCSHLIPDVRIANHQGKHDILRTPSPQVAKAG